MGSGIIALPMIAIILAIWRFNVWRWHTPKILRGLIEKKRMYVPDGDAKALYLHLLENYRDTLASPKRYFLSSFLMILVVIYNASLTGQILSVEHPNIAVTLLVVVEFTLSTLTYSVGMYCIGIMIWTMYSSGWYVRKLVQVFELRIQPRHPDQCGGLKVLGNFCFGLFSPILISSGLFLGYILLLFLESNVDVVGALTSGFALLVLYTFPVAIFALILPLRDIHAKMRIESEADEDAYIVRLEALEGQIQNLLDTNQIEEAKAIQEKKALMETLQVPYPTWPFSFRSKIFSTVLGVSGSLLLGLITAAVEQYFLPAILALLFHKP